MSFEKKIAFHKKFPRILSSLTITAIPFLVWDHIFTDLGVWGFNENYLLGIYFFQLPLEEILFFFCIPFACIFIYEVVNYYWEILSMPLEKGFTSILIIGSILIAINCSSLAYTSTTFIVLTILLGINLILNSSLKHFYVAYLITLIPFFIVNGILTGFGLQEPIVWYNNEENLGFRILSIPIEDIFYGMALILMNISIYKAWNNYSSNSLGKGK